MSHVGGRAPGGTYPQKVRLVRIAVLGAGNIGCYIGGRLQANGHDVVYIGREPLRQEAASYGITLSDYRGWSINLAPGDCEVSTSPAAVADADITLVTTKSAGTVAAANDLGVFSTHRSTVVSLQNGVRNVDELTRRLSGHVVVPGMVPFNVAKIHPAHFHQGSQGKIVIAAGHPKLVTILRAAGLAVGTHTDMAAVQWGKLVMNLNNAVNGLARLPLKEQLGQRLYRRVYAMAQREALQILRAYGQSVVSPILAPLTFLPLALDTPDAVFSTFAKRVVAIDPKARSSLHDDLAAGKPTEIDYINGEIVTIAEHLGLRAPVNQTLVDLVHSAEESSTRHWSGRELISAVATSKSGL
ncbi:2-dehydropantoate 2-reductase [Mycobacteroides abscessus subsp. massiliense]|uniref:2-dehydropantoate 2-reductase n=1 Tax=Mycobacteroides abscessus TaxID=36809 RepID=UPI0009A81DA1|nr:2-dehydropantoate 2-reductase [Mycobacteroides abscessus]SKH48357.1 2-dehydropantoate 2-reductase [Mycobacteroides abscessus subsp. massiliense]SKH82346.1 2-dehydropantoate 2-reductase [Mycobacteroides abscessus subsp. massiliense]SKK36311.1 2-dehydropantoate 2-reductase [Mycobacteroides abscessus subsp. massiliense]SKK43295.1 2-dehydropantoate 2-reductase [Mycobacteroides abscessus subsp. massiliense]SKL85204.1 2-dehydropantoate 2-reductase [Mycobacteroides abscessus subsp. massiliense]